MFDREFLWDVRVPITILVACITIGGVCGVMVGPNLTLVGNVFQFIFGGSLGLIAADSLIRQWFNTQDDLRKIERERLDREGERLEQERQANPSDDDRGFH